MNRSDSATGNGAHLPLKRNIVRLTLQDVTLSPHGKWHEGHFVFRNDTSASVKLPGFYGAPPREGVFRPHYVEYEVENQGAWKSLDVRYDGIPEQFTFEPDRNMMFIISLGPFEHQSVALDAQLRVRVGGYASDTFTLRMIAGGTVRP